MTFTDPKRTFIRYALVGVTSRGFGKCSIDLPSQYVRVTTIKSWIQENAPEAQDSSCNSIKIATTTAPKTTISAGRQIKG